MTIQAPHPIDLNCSGLNFNSPFNSTGNTIPPSSVPAKILDNHFYLNFPSIIGKASSSTIYTLTNTLPTYPSRNNKSASPINNTQSTKNTNTIDQSTNTTEPPISITAPLPYTTNMTTTTGSFSFSFDDDIRKLEALKRELSTTTTASSVRVNEITLEQVINLIMTPLIIPPIYLY